MSKMQEELAELLDNTNQQQETVTQKFSQVNNKSGSQAQAS